MPIARFSYLCMIWVLLHTAIMRFTPNFDTARARTPLALLKELTISPTNLWYLYALAAYVTIARLTVRLPTVCVTDGSFRGVGAGRGTPVA